MAWRIHERASKSTMRYYDIGNHGELFVVGVFMYFVYSFHSDPFFDGAPHAFEFILISEFPY